MPRHAGKVKWFSKDKGYGFITPDHGGDDCFVHRSGIRGKAPGNGPKSLTDGAAVEYEVTAGQKGPQAIDVVEAEPYRK